MYINIHASTATVHNGGGGGGGGTTHIHVPIATVCKSQAAFSSNVHRDC